MARGNSVTHGSGNVFKDLGLADAEELNTKARLGTAIVSIIQRDNLTQSEVGKKLGISQPKVSALVNYRFEGFSVERLIAFLTRLKCDVSIEISPSAYRSRKGVVLVSGIGIAIDASSFPKKRSLLKDDISVGGHTTESDHYLIHTLAEYACAFGLDKASEPILLPRMT